MAVFSIQTAFSTGEISPNLYGQVDLVKYHSAASTMRNSFVNYRGGAYSRAGTAMVLQSKQPYGTPPRVLDFQFSNEQGLALEFGEQYMRVVRNGAVVTEAAAAIASVTQANPCVVSAPNGYAVGDWVSINGIVGMAQLDGYLFIVSAATGSTVTLSYLDGSPVDSTMFPAYVSGGTIARVYTVATPWHAADLGLLKFTQSGDTLTVTHTSYPTYDLVRVSDTNWTVTATTFGSSVAPPASCSVTATVQPNGTTTFPAAYAYCVTAVGANGEESIASPIGNVTNSVDIASTAGSLIVTWAQVAGARYYNIYRAPTSYNTQPGVTTNALPVPVGSIFSFVGTSFGTTFVDSNITPDFTQVPPTHQNPFAPGQILAVETGTPGTGYTTASLTVTTSTGSGLIVAPVISGGGVVAWIVQNAGQGYLSTDTVAVSGDGTGATATLSVGPQTGTYPGAVAYFQQRRVYASTLNNPDTYYMTQPGSYTNMDTSIPVMATDAIVGTPWGTQVNGIQFMVPMPGGLVVLTGLGAYQVGGSGSSALNPRPITPSSQQATPQAFNGVSSSVPPITVDYDILYVQSKGSIVLDLAWNYWINIYTGTDITEFSGHLFTSYTLVQWAWCREPYKIVWAVRNDGILLSLTFVKPQQVQGWARHDTLGQFVSVASVTELPVDALYCVVARPTNSAGGGYVYYIERMDNRLWTSTEDPWCVDCGLQYPMPAPAAALTIGAPISGYSAVVATASVFGAASIGSVLRALGGVGTITASGSGTTATVLWSLAPSGYVPNDPNGNLLPVASGGWTLTAPTQVVSGLRHLAGLTVTGLADGVPIAPQVVTAAGTITLPVPASNIRVGLPFTAQVQLPYLDPGTAPTVQGRRKTITAVTGRFDASAMIEFGTNQPDGAAQVPPVIAPPWSGMVAAADPGTPYTSPGGGTVVPLATGDIRIPVGADWSKRGQPAFQQPNPLPMNLTAVIPEYLEGDTPEVSYGAPSHGAGGAPEQLRGSPAPQQGPQAWMLGGLPRP